MKLNETQHLPAVTESAYDRQLQQVLQPWVRTVAVKVNQIASGAVAGFDNARTSVPTTGTWAQGDFVRNGSPSELGTTPNKYVIAGWMCVVSGTPGTWVQQRFLTGN